MTTESTHAPLEVVQLQLGPIGTNCYIVRREGDDRALLIDPGADAERVLETLRERGLRAAAVLVTHSHWDHIGAVAPVAREFGIPVYMSRIEAFVMETPNDFVPEQFGPIEPHPPEHLLDGGEHLDLAGIELDVLHLPGHSPGSLGFAVAGTGEPGDDRVTPPMLFVGDLIFEGSVGRTDLPFADHDTLLDSCRVVLGLADDTVLLSGHGNPTTVARERRTNPFLRDL